ncbi:hypothetical protein NKH18_13845 [Streptomyces sp. M10(2022)]
MPLRNQERAADATVASRVRAVLGFYRYHAARGVEVAGQLYETVHSRPGSYLPFWSTWRVGTVDVRAW